MHIYICIYIYIYIFAVEGYARPQYSIDWGGPIYLPGVVLFKASMLDSLGGPSAFYIYALY